MACAGQDVISISLCLVLLISPCEINTITLPLLRGTDAAMINREVFIERTTYRWSTKLAT